MQYKFNQIQHLGTSRFLKKCLSSLFKQILHIYIGTFGFIPLSGFPAFCENLSSINHCCPHFGDSIF